MIILAEAGSGKSIELEEQARALITAGECAFHATVKNVASYGLATAIGRPAAARLAEWQLGNRIAWFLIDSVDEAKLDHIRLRQAPIGSLATKSTFSLFGDPFAGERIDGRSIEGRQRASDGGRAP